MLKNKIFQLEDHACQVEFKKKTLCCLQELHLTFKRTERLKGKGWEKVSHSSNNQKKNEVVTLHRSRP